MSKRIRHMLVEVVSRARYKTVCGLYLKGGAMAEGRVCRTWERVTCKRCAKSILTTTENKLEKEYANDRDIDYDIDRKIMNPNRESIAPEKQLSMLPHYSFDANAVRLVEAKLESLGLHHQYIACLWILNGNSIPDKLFSPQYYESLMRLVHASPKDKCRAALIAIDKTECYVRNCDVETMERNGKV